MNDKTEPWIRRTALVILGLAAAAAIATTVLVAWGVVELVSWATSK